MRLFTYCMLLLASGSAWCEAREPDPLFQSDEILQVTIKGPFVRIMRSRSLVDEEDGTFIYTDSDGSQQELSIKLRTRGKSRKNPAVCKFAPLRLNFKTSATKDTLFEKQDKLKLVTHCKEKSTRHEQSLFREYLAYRVLNTLTEKSFRVRLLQVTYEDTAQKRKPIKQYAFLIEHKDRLGKRIDQKPLDDIDRVSASKLHGDYFNITSVFQYLLANLDFSAIASSDEDSCCHNHTLFGEGDGPYYSIPYDFDMSGFVNAKYAEPNPRFGLKSITARLYRGRCRNNVHMDNTIALFLEKQEEIFALVEEFPLLNDKYKKQLGQFIGKFYDIASDPAMVEKRLTGKCL